MTPDTDGSARAASAADDPAAALGDIWEALDSLPRSVTPPSVTATTIEMVAVSAQSRAVLAARPTPLAWLAAAGLTIAGFLGGVAAGRSTLPSPDDRLLQQLPLAENLEFLQELGSVEFLAEMARRNYPPPRGFAMAQSPGDDRSFDAALEALRASHPERSLMPQALAKRRARVQALSEDERLALEDRLRDVAQLGSMERRQLADLANALASPGKNPLLAAARLWHAWVGSRDPAERRSIIALGTAERLEWLDRYARLQSRMQMRQFIEREREHRRGPPAPEEKPGPPR